MHDLEMRVINFINKCHHMRMDEFNKRFTQVEPEPLGYKINNKYIKIFLKNLDNGQPRSVFAFIDKSNGDILKPASWKVPAKHARSNIYDEDYGMSGIDVHGPKYLI